MRGIIEFKNGCLAGSGERVKRRAYVAGESGYRRVGLRGFSGLKVNV